MKFAEIRNNLKKSNPGRVYFRREKRGSLPRGHVGFGMSDDGYAYVHETLSPSARLKITKPMVFLTYERPASAVNCTDPDA